MQTMLRKLILNTVLQTNAQDESYHNYLHNYNVVHIHSVAHIRNAKVSCSL